MYNEIICCDWGTSSFRLRLVRTIDLEVLAATDEGQGIARVFSLWKDSGRPRFDFYAEILKSSIATLSDKSGRSLTNIPVVVSGMASSSIGMHEVPYAGIPFGVDGANASVELSTSFNGQDGHLMIVSGVRSADDVMRGEEAQLIGLYCLPETSYVNDKQCIIVLPGTHSKHILVEEKAISGFKTYMTGEMFNVISRHTILKDSIANGAGQSNSESEAFVKGVQVSGERNILNSLFTTRTNQLFGKFTPAQNAMYLSGILIGAELNDLRDIATDMPVYISCGKHLESLYKMAADTLLKTKNIQFIDHGLIEKATIAGQLQIFQSNTSNER